LRKPPAFIALLAAVAVLMSGCWDRREVNELAIVLGAGIDLAPGGQVRLTLQLAKPRSFAAGGATGGGGAKAEPPTWTVSETGSTVFDAQKKLAASLSRSIDFKHCLIYIFGEEVARRGMIKYENYFVRSAEAREISWVLVAKGEAGKILETSSQLEIGSALEIDNIARSKNTHSINLKNFIATLSTPGANPIASRVEVVEQGVTWSPEEKLTRHKVVAITGVAAFREDKLAGWLNEEEMEGMIWLRGDMAKMDIVIPSLNEPNKKLAINVTRYNTKVEPYYDGKTIKFGVKVALEGNLAEQESKEDILDEKVRRALEKEIAGDVQKKARLALEKAQGEYGVDIFYFGGAFHRKYPKDWRKLKNKWNDIFPSVEVDLAVEAHIRNSGLEGGRPSSFLKIKQG